MSRSVIRNFIFGLINSILKVNDETTEACGLVVMGDAQDMLSVRSKVRVQRWTHLDCLSQQLKVH